MNIGPIRLMPRCPAPAVLVSSLLGCTGNILPSADPAGVPGETGGPIVDSATGKPAVCQQPGHLLMRRLNHTEYNNTLRDLGFRDRPADGFVADDSLGGFDNNSSVLTVSPQLAEQVELAGQR